MTFLAILLSSIFVDGAEGHKEFCGFKMKKVAVIEPNEYINYAADMNIILSNRKLLDDYKDDKNYFALAASKFIGTKKLSDMAKSRIDLLDKHLEDLRKLEKSKCTSIDETGHCFAELTSEIFSVSDGIEGKVLKVLGYNVGKWIYTVDAFDDLEKDIKDKKYNPFIYNFNYRGEKIEDFKKSILENAEFTLIRCLDEISKAAALIDVRKNSGIVENIIYLGMKEKTMKVLKGENENEKSL
jgi:hypothetical protein